MKRQSMKRQSMKRLSMTLHEYVAGDLSKEQRAAIEKRIENEPRVRALYEEILEAHNALTSLRDRPAPVSADDVLPRIQAAITAQKYQDRPRLFMDGAGRRYYRRIAMAATLLLAVTVGLLVARNNRVEPAAPATTGGLDARPTADVRGLVDAASAGPLDGLTVIELLNSFKKAGNKPNLVFTPNEGVLPVSEGLTEKR